MSMAFSQGVRTFRGALCYVGAGLKADQTPDGKPILSVDVAGGGGGVIPGIYPISAYGAALDGIIDDSAAWQSAIDAAWAAGGGVVQWFGIGTSIVKNLRMRDGVTLELGPDATLKLAPSAVAGDFVLGNHNFALGNNDIVVRGGRFDASSATAELGDNITAFQFLRVNRLQIHGSYITGGIAEGGYFYDVGDLVIHGVSSVANGIPDLDGSGIHLDTCTRARLTAVLSAENGFDGVLFNYCTAVSGSAVSVPDNHRDGVRMNGCTDVSLFATGAGNKRGIYLNESNTGVGVAGFFTDNAYHGVLTGDGTTECSFMCTSTGNGPGGAGFDVYFLEGSSSNTFDGRAGTVNDEGTDNRVNAGPVVYTSDPRLEDARTPLAHAESHYAGPDALDLDSIPGELDGSKIAGAVASADTLSGYGSAFYLSRANHTGTSPWSAVSKLTSSLADLATRSASDLNSGNLPAARLPTGPTTWDLGLTGGISNDLTVTNGFWAAPAAGVSASLKVGTVVGTAGAKAHIASTSSAQLVQERQGTGTNVSMIFRLPGPNDVYVGQGAVGEFAVGTGADLRTVGFRVSAASGNTRMAQATITGSLLHSGSTLGLLGAAAVARQTFTGSRGSNAALQSVINALVAYGLGIDSTTI